MGLLEVSGWRLSQPWPEEESGAEAQRGQGAHPNLGVGGVGARQAAPPVGKGSRPRPRTPSLRGAATPHVTPQEPVGPSALLPPPRGSQRTSSPQPATPSAARPLPPSPHCICDAPGKKAGGEGATRLDEGTRVGRREAAGGRGEAGRREALHKREGAALPLLQEPPRAGGSAEPASRLVRPLVSSSVARPPGPWLHPPTACP